MARAAQHEQLAQLDESVAQPATIALGDAHHARGHGDEVVRLELGEGGRFLRTANAGRREQQRRGYSQHG